MGVSSAAYRKRLSRARQQLVSFVSTQGGLVISRKGLDHAAFCTTHHPQPAARSPGRSAGVWLSLVLVVYRLFNAVRAVTNPFGFAATYGTPLADGNNTAFVTVYAIRALFIGLFGLALIVRMQWRALALFALVAVVMPVGDAVLVAAQGGAAVIIVRHALADDIRAGLIRF